MVEEGRGSLPFALIHGEALVVAAVWALGEAGVVPVDLTTPWSAVREAAAEGSPYVLHDALCPMTPPAFIAGCVARARADDVVVVGVRAVTDTVKQVTGHDTVGATLDRETLVSVCSPVVLPASLVARLDALVSLDLAVLVSRLGDEHAVVQVSAPSEARRVASLDDVAVLEALTGGQQPVG